MKREQRNNMIVHIMNASPIVNEYITLVNRYCDKKEHVFVVGPNGKTCKKVIEEENIIRVRKWYSIKGIIDMICYMNRADYIIAHGLFSGKTVLFFFFQPWLLKKTNWLIWGGDIYGRRDKKQTIYTRMVDWMKSRIVRYFPYITTLVDGDYAIAEKAYHISGKHLKAVYPSPLLMNSFATIKIQEKAKERGPIRILVGNSATESNQHEDAFNMLMKYKDEDIRIYVPLSYGPEEYGERIAILGKKIFGDKFIPMRSFMKKDEYTEFLQTIQIGLFNNNRQQAMGNINQLLLLNKKVYIRDDTTMWTYYENDLGCRLHSINEIKHQTFEEFIFTSDVENQWNQRKIIESRDEKHVVNMWKEVFSQMKKEDGKRYE